MPALLRIERPAPDEYFSYFERYVARVPGDDAIEALATGHERTIAMVSKLTQAQAHHRYAPDKWSVQEVLVHLADCERVFDYRALHFARNDANPLPGFDENAWAPESRSDARAIAEVVDDLRVVRAATLALFRSFDAEALLRRGIANQRSMSVRGAAWIIAGHELHHQGVLRERYGLDG
jgi:uncharacterized damage-inducible protein DinB